MVIGIGLARPKALGIFELWQTSGGPQPPSLGLSHLSMAHVRVEHIHMEHVRMRDNNSSPHPTENSAPSLIQADLPPQPPNRREPDTECPAGPSPPPSTLNLQYDDKPPPLSKSLFRGFERPSYSHIAILTALCFITYPAFYILTLVAKDKSLFIVRSIVSVWCWGAGFALGYILLKIGAQHLEAASEFTLLGYRDFLRLYFKQPGPP